MAAIVIKVDADLADLVPAFLENRHRDVRTIVDCVRIGDFREIQRLAHMMKGAGGGYGFHEVTEIGDALETAALAADAEAVRALIHRLKQYLGNLDIRYVPQKAM